MNVNSRRGSEDIVPFKPRRTLATLLIPYNTEDATVFIPVAKGCNDENIPPPEGKLEPAPMHLTVPAVNDPDVEDVQKEVPVVPPKERTQRKPFGVLYEDEENIPVNTHEDIEKFLASETAMKIYVDSERKCVLTSTRPKLPLPRTRMPRLSDFLKTQRSLRVIGPLKWD